MKVLIVDDAVRTKLLFKALTDSGFECKTANYQEAQEAAKEVKLVIIDPYYGDPSLIEQLSKLNPKLKFVG